MAEFLNTLNKTVPTSGTVDIPLDPASAFPDCNVVNYRLVGETKDPVDPVELVGDVIIAPQGTAILNQKVTFFNEANYTLGVSTITIFGVVMPSALATKAFKVESIYDGSAWQTSYYIAVNEDGWIETSDIADEAVTVDKMADLARGHLLIGNSSTRPVAVDFTNSGYIGIGDGTDYNSVAQSGDVIFSNAGVAAIQPGVIVNADVNAAAAIAHSKLAAMTSGYVLVGSAGTVPTAVAISGDATLSSTGVLSITNNGIIKTLSVTIPTASVLTLFATPVTIIPAQGAGTYIEVISATMQMTFGGAGVAYATNGVMRLLTTGAVIGQCSWTANGGLFGTTTRMVSATMTTPTLVGDTQLIANTAVVCQVDTGNPTAGNSNIVIKVCYRVIS
jgi:hypothetical protein